jgi:hypothetical protein
MSIFFRMSEVLKEVDASNIANRLFTGSDSVFPSVKGG